MDIFVLFLTAYIVGGTLTFTLQAAIHDVRWDLQKSLWDAIVFSSMSLLWPAALVAIVIHEGEYIAEIFKS